MGAHVPDGVVLTSAAAAELTVDEREPLLRAAADELGAGPFAVRSSGIAEDGAEASYAGMYETVLNVSADELATATNRSISSAGAARVAAYTPASHGPDGRTTTSRDSTRACRTHIHEPLQWRRASRTTSGPARRSRRFWTSACYAPPGMRIVVRLILAAIILVAGWLVGSGIGILVGLGLDAAAGEEAWVSSALLTLPLFGFIGILVGAALAARIFRGSGSN